MIKLPEPFKGFVLFFFTIVLAAGIAAECFSSTSSFGMVTLLTGPAFYSNAEKINQEKLAPFMKLYEGDTVTLGEGASLQLIAFATGRKEDWHGPAVFTIDVEKGCMTKDPENQPKISFMPEVVTNEVRRISNIIDPSRVQKAGAVIVRGTTDQETKSIEPVAPDAGEKREINLAKNTYHSLLKESDPSDITPELFLFSVLADFDQYDEMDQLIAVMKNKQPGNPTIGRLTEWLENQK